MEPRVSFQRTEALEHKLDFYPSHCCSVTSSYIVSQDVDLMVSCGISWSLAVYRSQDVDLMDSCGLIEFSLTKQ